MKTETETLLEIIEKMQARLSEIANECQNENTDPNRLLGRIQYIAEQAIDEGNEKLTMKFQEPIL